MFWDFGSAISSQRQAAGDHVQKSASRDPQQSQDPQQQQRTSRKKLYLASDCDTLPKSTSESTDKENTYEIIRGNNIRVGAERFRCTELATNLYRKS